MPKDKRVKTRLLLLSDTHTIPPAPATSTSKPYRHPLPKADILLHAGDLTKVGRKEEHEAMLAMLRDADAELKIIIAGNHDITLDEDYYARTGHLRHRYRTNHLAASPTRGKRKSSGFSSSSFSSSTRKDSARSHHRTSTSNTNTSSSSNHPSALIGNTEREYQTDSSTGSEIETQPSDIWPGSGTGRSDSPGEDGLGPIEDPAAIKALYTGDEARGAGIRYMEEGVSTFFLSNGARVTVYASPWTPEFCQWAFAYDRSVDRFNPPPPPPLAASSSTSTSTSGGVSTPKGGGRGGREEALFIPPNPVPNFPDVDIMLTHGPPYGMHDRVVTTHESVGCEHLAKAVRRAKPQLHVFGHIHEGYGATRLEWSTGNESLIQVDRETMLEDRAAYVDVSREGGRPLREGEETLFVNASVVTVQYEPTNAPWVVDLDLPSK